MEETPMKCAVFVVVVWGKGYIVAHDKKLCINTPKI